MTRWLTRVALATVVRRLTLIVLAALLAWCGVGKAHAQSYANCNVPTEGNANCPTKEAAYAALHARLAHYAALSSQQQSGTVNHCLDGETVGNGVQTGSKPGRRINGHLGKTGSSGPCHFNSVANGWRWFPESGDCPADKPWNPETETCGGPCANKPDITNLAVRRESGFSACVEGCTYSAVLDTAEPSRVMGQGANRTVFASTWASDGQQCTVGDPSDAWNGNKPICEVLADGSKNCVYPNGDQCNVQGDTIMCWGSGETGHRNTQDKSQGADRQQAPTPNTPPPGMQDPQTGSTSSTTINNTTYNSTNYTGTPSGTPGQGNVGNGGNDPTDPSGGGEGPGQGGDGEDGEGDGPGEPGAGVGTLYEGSEKTVASVYASFRTSVENAPIVQVGQGVFGNCTGGGSCPSATWDAGLFDFVADLQQLCSGDLSSLMQWAGWIAFAGMCFFAFKVGFL